MPRRKPGRASQITVAAPPTSQAKRSWWVDAPTREEFDKRVDQETPRMKTGKFGKVIPYADVEDANG